MSAIDPEHEKKLVMRLQQDKTWQRLLLDIDNMRLTLQDTIAKERLFGDTSFFSNQIKNFFDDYLKELIRNDGMYLWTVLTDVLTLIFPIEKKVWAEIVDHLWKELFIKNTLVDNVNIKVNNEALLESLIFGYEGPTSTETYLRREDIFILDKIINCFSNPLLFAKSNQEFLLREDLALATVSEALRDLSNRKRLRRMATFVGLETIKNIGYDQNSGTKVEIVTYSFQPEMRTIIEKYHFITEDIHTGKKQLNVIPREFFLCLIQAWRVNNRNSLDEYTVNALCGGIALHLLTGFFDREKYKFTHELLAKLPKQFFHEMNFLPLIIPLIKIIAYFINGNDWLELIFDSKTKKHYHRLIRATMLGSVLALINGTLYARTNAITNRIGNNRSRVNT